MTVTRRFRKSTFYNSGFYLIGVFVLAILGFWPTYFAIVFKAPLNFDFYIHAHALIMLLWVVTLIVQPILIKNRLNKWHILIGKFSYVHIALIFISAILLVHSRVSFRLDSPALARDVFVPFKDLIVIGLAWGMAMIKRKNSLLHARYMICTSFAFIEPALVRFIRFTVPGIDAYLVNALILDLLLAYLIFRDRKYPEGRNVFTLFLCLYLVLQAIVLSGANFEPWISFSRWFAGLNLT